MASVQTLAPTVLRRMLSVAEWEALEDPIGGRYEILDGRLILNPSPGGDHNRIGEAGADMIRAAIDDAELDYEVTIDVEWRVVENGRIPQAPRGDIVIGHLDPSKGIHYELPLFVIEIWSPKTRPSVRTKKRDYWIAQGLRHYWSVRLGVVAAIDAYDLHASDTPVVVFGDQTLTITSPFALTVIPNEIKGWTLRQHRQAKQEAARAEREAARADAAEARIRSDFERLRAAGIDVDAILRRHD